ncbi:MAG: hypothetical protein NCW75_14905 [Phycisphaera sp.]|nr:MAG: hypothetical protein NCW75_14905 [Phycisphaera sp.]
MAATAQSTVVRNARTLSTGAAIAVLLAGAGMPAVADPAANDYCVEHVFNITTRGNLPPELRLKHQEYAYARCGRAKDKDTNLAINVVGVGVSTFTALAVAGTISEANSETDVTTLAVGAADGTIRVYGDVDLCPVGPGQRSAYGRAWSAAKLFYRGRGMDRRGRIGWVGRWRAEPGIKGGVGKVRRVDPVIGRVIDNTTGITTEYLLIDIDNFVQGGDFEWADDQMVNNAPTMDFEMIVPGDVTPQSGSLIIRARGGLITESTATGMFAGVAVPAVGAASTFSMDLSNNTEIEFDMPGDDDHDLDVEIEMGGAGEHEEVDAYIGGDTTTTTDLIGGPNDSPVLVVPAGAPRGVQITPGETTIAQPFLVQDGEVWTPDSMAVRLIQPFTLPDQPLEAIGVQIWNGFPGDPTSTVIAGDLFTNRLDDTIFTGIYAVNEGETEDPSHPIVEALVDMQWVPPMPPGQYFVEFTAQGTGPEPVLLPPSPFLAGEFVEPGLVGFAGGGYEPIFSPVTDQPSYAPMMIFGEDGIAPTCRADLDGDGQLTIFDFLEFQNLFGLGDPIADFDGDGRLTIFDFLAFQNEFVAGCPG